MVWKTVAVILRIKREEMSSYWTFRQMEYSVAILL